MHASPRHELLAKPARTEPVIEQLHIRCHSDSISEQWLASSEQQPEQSVQSACNYSASSQVESVEKQVWWISCRRIAREQCESCLW